MCGSTLFHVLRKQNISLYAFVSTNAVLVKKKGRGIFAILRPFPVGKCFVFSYCFIAGSPLAVLFDGERVGRKEADYYFRNIDFILLKNIFDRSGLWKRPI